MIKTREKSKRPRAVVLISGGMDSCVTAAIAAQNHDVYALHASYGQRTEAREIKAFRKVAQKIGAVLTLEVDLKALRKIGASSLVDRSAPIPTRIKTGQVPSTYVPFRNGVLMSVATAWAESVGAKKIFIGAVAIDGPEGYPDTTRNFFDSFERTANIGTKPETKIKIMTPVIGMTKTEVVKTGLKLDAPFRFTWSCYQNETEACGVCLSCKARMKAFEEAGIKDPIPYAAYKEKASK